MFCNNCGIKGHGFRACPEPITSYGIILIDRPSLPVHPLETRVLMIRRKDSMSFSEFMQGRYRVDDLPYIQTLLQNMTMQELAWVQTKSFQELWTMLWGVGNDYHSKTYRESKQKFEQIQPTPTIQQATSLFIEPEWGFPKGRRHSRETNLQCAIREFTEETNIPRNSYVVCKNLLFQETFRGTNGVHYRHIYFLACVQRLDQINLYQNMTVLQRQEVSCIRWMSLGTCKQLVRPHYRERLELLDSFEHCLQTFDVQDNVACMQE
jgi:8-oxo-dGTP pyrophosphatase MutT (NUDIX family)